MEDDAFRPFSRLSWPSSSESCRSERGTPSGRNHATRARTGAGVSAVDSAFRGRWAVSLAGASEANGCDGAGWGRDPDEWNAAGFRVARRVSERAMQTRRPAVPFASSLRYSSAVAVLGGAVVVEWLRGGRACEEVVWCWQRRLNARKWGNDRTAHGVGDGRGQWGCCGGGGVGVNVMG